MNLKDVVAVAYVVQAADVWAAVAGPLVVVQDVCASEADHALVFW